MDEVAKVRFDDALPVFARTVAEFLGRSTVESGVFIRDVSGRLAFFSSDRLKPEVVDKLSAVVRVRLGEYARTDRLIADQTEFGAEEILKEAGLQSLTIDGLQIRLGDRRIVGVDWLRAPSDLAPPPPRFVFASLKGGVGRSTALCVTAADLAARGLRILAVDFDLEAPGLGAMLFDEKTLPEYGLVDALTEGALYALDRSFLADLVSASPLGDGRGRIDVVPAFGRRSLTYPGNVLAKLSRAYLEVPQDDGRVLTLLDRVRVLVDMLAGFQRYDAILVDSRAGLHESTPAAILGLGAEVFLFGLNEPQTFQGYSALFSHLARLGSARQAGWLDRLTMIQGRADPNSRRQFEESCDILFAMFSERQRISDTKVVPLPAEPFSNVPWDDSAEVDDLELTESASSGNVTCIFDDERFKNFHPIARKDLLSKAVYNSAYGEFLAIVWGAIEPMQEGT